MPTIGVLLEHYCRDREPLVASTQRLASTTNHLHRHLGKLQVTALNRHALQRYGERRAAEGVKPQTVRRELITLRAALRLAWKDERIDRVPPIPMPPTGQPRQRCLTPAEIKRLRQAVAGEPPMALLVDLLLATGARIGAALELTWERVSLERGEIDFRADHPRAARRKHRAVVPISKALARRVKPLRQASGPVIGWEITKVRRHWRLAIQAAKLPGVTPHVLRHTVATHLLRHVPLIEASRLVGHRSVAVTEEVYGHLTAGDLRGAAETLSKLLE